jgi:hypothetical protein
MRRFARLTGFGAAVLVLVGAVPLAMTAARHASRPPAMTIDDLIEEGDRFAVEGEFEAARAEYEVAAELLRHEGQLPVEAIRRIANSYFFEGDYEDVAAVLERLADEAESHGDLETQVFAVADAATLARLTGDRNEELRHRERLALVLSAPELPDGVRERIRSKVNAKFQVFAPHLASC